MVLSYDKRQLDRRALKAVRDAERASVGLAVFEIQGVEVQNRVLSVRVNLALGEYPGEGAAESLSVGIADVEVESALFVGLEAQRRA